MNTRRRAITFLSLLALLTGVTASISPIAAIADHTADPAAVTIAGSLQSELGCPDDWQPECATTHLGFDAEDGVWQGTFNVPAGSWEYKAPLNDSWAENYGAGAVADGPNIALNLGAAADVKFYYSHATHWVTDNVSSVIAVAPGDFQSELGCSGDWDPGCLRSWLQDPDGDGIFTFLALLPGGDYEAKVVINEDWAENYGAGGVAGGVNIPFSVSAPLGFVEFSFDDATKILTINEVPDPSQPDSVAIAGNLQSELGCPDDWQPECAATDLAYDAEDRVWQGSFNVPAGNWEYKAPLNDSWTENYGANATPDGPNIPLSLGAPTDVKFYYEHGTHWVTDDVNSVIATVAGNFQSELGCIGDWDPSCLRSWLQDPDGDGVYSFATDEIPAGGYEFKVALDEGWAVSHPAANVSFTAVEGTTITFTYDSNTNEVAVASTGGLEPGDELLVRPLLEHPFQDQVLYFVIPDRFNDGDAANNCADFAGPCVDGDTQSNVLTHGYLPSDRGYYHGGDIAGLHDKLDYLEALGVTAIWVGPIYRNKTVQPDTTNLYGHSSGYHGYWILDFLEVDPHLGTNAEFQALVDDAHSRNIKVFMDVVTNHTADVIQLEGNDGYRDKASYPYADAFGVPFDDSDFAYAGQADYTFPAIDASSFPYNPIVPPGEETVKNPAWLNDPLLYHNRGNTSFTGENSLYGDFFGLDDLWTERKEVVDGMVDIFSFWIEEFGIDGFRIDTTKHVNMEFWQKFGPDIAAAADSKGIGEFFAFGEVYDQQFGPSFLSEFSTRGRLQSTIDFAFQLAARDFASLGGATDNLRAFFAADDYYTDADSNAYAMPTFVGNHDMGRIGHFLQRQDQPGAGDTELMARSLLAQALMYFSRGTPVIYYGDEQGFTGDGGDKLARQDMFPTLVPEYADDDHIGTTGTGADDNFDPTHPIYQALADYAALYQAHPALRRGAQIHRFSTGGAGVYAFSRIERVEQVEYLIAFNNDASPAAAAVPTFYEGGAQFDLVLGPPAAPASLVTAADGTVDLNVPGLGLVIYRATLPIPASTAAPSIAISNLANGQTVTLAVESQDGHDVVERLEVVADLGNDSLAEVTFAASVDGGDYQPIGTDGNPPYRVFYDTTSLPAGATLSFKAIVDDLAGNLNAAKVEGIVPLIEEPAPPGGPADYAVVHYNRPAGDYGDHTTGDFNDFWGLHLWGDAIDPAEVTDWASPKAFQGEDEFGRFAWIRRGGTDSQVNFIIHQGDTKDTDPDRLFNADTNAQIWINQGDETVYLSQADAQGFATVHYHRDDGDYGTPGPDYNTFWGLHLWGDAIDPAEGTEWTTPKPPDGIDDYGAFWTIDVVDSAQPLNYIIHRGDTKDPGPDESFIPGEMPTVWKQSGEFEMYPTRGAAEGYATIHYHRDGGDYGDNTSLDFNDFWGMHVWDGALSPNPAWQEPVRWSELDVFGPVFEVDLMDGAPGLAYIIHRGDSKDPGPDQFLMLDKWGYEVWQLEGPDPSEPDEPHYVLPMAGAAAAPGDIDQQRAYWVSEDTIVWVSGGNPSADYSLCYAPTGGMTLGAVEIDGGTCSDLNLGAPYPAGIDGFRHLAGLPTLRIPAGDLAAVPALLTGQVAVQAVAGGARLDATGLQIPGVLDDLYATDVPLGALFNGDPALRLWAPTAKAVTLHLFDDANPATPSATFPMAWDAASGTWSASGDATWRGKYYLYEVEVYVPSTDRVENNIVTDPYSVSLAMNSTRSQIVDLSEPGLAPPGWDMAAKPGLDAFEAIAIYELHVRDFSANDATVPEPLRGSYAAFTLSDTEGMSHLKSLADAGLTHVHLLPTFDIATIDEDKSTWQQPDHALLETYPGDSDQQQAAVEATADVDAFNWGYDPFHYTTPEGSYSTDPDGTARVVEYRAMVQSLNDAGLRVVMDVVYNHTNAAGQNEKSVLDRIVPGYYHRLNDSGEVETSTCCANTATEHQMMGRLMVDSVVTWAKEYKVDGFRFDLMGHHSLANMLEVRAALDALTLADDGVDGPSIFIYGEGWNFGEVADDARFIQATQLNSGGTGIGTFNDRLRDAVRGGGPFDGGTSRISNQGFINGLAYDPNAQALPADEAEAELLLSADQIRVGLAGNLAAYEFEAADGVVRRGDEIDYNGAPAGYTEDPQENIVYVSAHDNETLFDVSQYKHPAATSTADRARAQNLGIDITALAQGVNFFHAGVDMLRSKSLDRDSFNSGDWFNRLDFTYQDNNWAVGLPVASKNQAEWAIMQPLLADPALAPAPADVAASVAHIREMLAIESSSPLFNLPTAGDIQERVAFHNTGPAQVPGMIVMSISDLVGADLDPEFEEIVVVFNATSATQAFSLPASAGREWELHPVQQTSVDAVVRTAGHDLESGVFSVPPRTTAVFVTDITPPVTTASLDFVRGGEDSAWFTVGYSCTDASGATVTAAEINGIAVVDGEDVHLVTLDDPDAPPRWRRTRKGKLTIWDFSFVLSVTCEDGAGNSATTTVVPEFR